MTVNGSFKKHYDLNFSQLTYQNKVETNEITDYLKSKRLNRLAQQKIMADVTELALACQNREEPLEQLFGSDRALFCDKLIGMAPLASTAEKALAMIRNIAAISLIISLITLFISLFHGNGIYLSGVSALQTAGGVLLFIMCFPMVGYRDALRMPFNRTIPGPAEFAAKSRVLPQMIIYSLVCIAGVVAYGVVFWLHPDSLVKLGLDKIELNLLAWVVIFAAIFLASLFGEISVVRKNFRHSRVVV